MNASENAVKNFSTILVKHRWLWHVVYWGVYAASRAIMYYSTIMYYDVKYLKFMLLTEVSLVVLTYVTIWWHNRYFAVQQYGIYFSVGLFGWIGYVCLLICFQKYYLASIPEIANQEWSNFFLYYITNYLVAFVFLTMAKYFKNIYIEQYYAAQRKQWQIQSELQHLKAQISPHFLFNTMNNFYGLAVERSDKLPELMVRLSSLLRYSLYETKNELVSLDSELVYLRDYIALEKIRLEDTLDFEFNSMAAEGKHGYIAPLLLIVFVENAFKHAKNVQNDIIRIKISAVVSAENRLYFEVVNNCLEESKFANNQPSGIGLDNVQKRLQVLYPNGLHQLSFEKVKDTFRVCLNINLQK